MLFSSLGKDFLKSSPSSLVLTETVKCKCCRQLSHVTPGETKCPKCGVMFQLEPIAFASDIFYILPPVTPETYVNLECYRCGYDDVVENTSCCPICGARGDDICKTGSFHKLLSTH